MQLLSRREVAVARISRLGTGSLGDRKSFCAPARATVVLLGARRVSADIALELLPGSPPRSKVRVSGDLRHPSL
jgi:hypothetical protein